jgi:steroid delta-isomerase-like uncharacterized protein
MVSGHPMSAEANKSIILKLYQDLFRDWDISLIDKHFSPSFVDHLLNRSVGDDYDVTGPKTVHELYEFLRSAFPDLVFHVHDVIAQGDRVVVRWSWTCTHLGEFVGIPPTGKKAEISGIAIYRLEDGNIAERWVSTNLDGLIQKLAAESD